MADHKAALQSCKRIAEYNFTPEVKNLAAAYLELRKLAKAFYNDPWIVVTTAYTLGAAVEDDNG